VKLDTPTVQRFEDDLSVIVRVERYRDKPQVPEHGFRDLLQRSF
jgi:hypothetical protein